MYLTLPTIDSIKIILVYCEGLLVTFVSQIQTLYKGICNLLACLRFPVSNSNGSKCLIYRKLPFAVCAKSIF